MQRILTAVIFFLLFVPFSAVGTDVPIMSKEELRKKLGSSGILILDARSGNHWDSSVFKIPRAVRTPPSQIESWSMTLPKEKTLVVYCACRGLGTSGSLVRQLIAKGFPKVYALDGGWRNWYGSAFPIQEIR